MSWFRNVISFAALVAISTGALAAKNEEKSRKAEKTKEDAGKKKKTKPADEEGDATSKMSVPLPVGHEAKKLAIPYRDGSGKIQMRFVMELGKRIDADHLAMTTLHIQTYDDAEAEEMSILLPQALLDLNTRIITTESGVTIKRAEFELHGKILEFNTETKLGRLGGGVQMKIFNLQNETNPEPEAKSLHEK